MSAFATSFEVQPPALLFPEPSNQRRLSRDLFEIHCVASKANLLHFEFLKLTWRAVSLYVLGNESEADDVVYTTDGNKRIARH